MFALIVVSCFIAMGPLDVYSFVLLDPDLFLFFVVGHPES